MSNSKVSRKDIERIISERRYRLSRLSDPYNWNRHTKDMECGELRKFKQSCVDDEIVIAALTDILDRNIELSICENAHY